ncbi:tyrosine-type recombinase/integrase [Kocuria rhizophila]|uniref:tyrosine-type recombinase/integrase n=1 Tax=Kocuria rhizophila TaxID=72000 RepID=UPI003D6DFDD5
MASIRERTRKDGTTAWAVLWRDADTGKQTSRTLATRADAQSLSDFLNANGQSFALAAQAASKLRSTAPPVATIVSEHIEGLTGVSAGTREKYRRIAARHITPFIGAVPVDTLTRTDVNCWVNGMTVAAKTKKNVHSLLSAALTDATARGLVDANVAKGVKLPTGEARREPVFLTVGELDLIVATIPEPRHKLLVQFLAGTGLRWSEATALQVADLDLAQEHGVAAVSRAWKRAGGEWVTGAPKTARGRRSVVLPKTLTAQLREHVADKAPGDLVFPSREGPLHNVVFHRLVWDPAMRALAGQLHARPRVHDLRHTHASRLIAAGVPLTVIQRRLGHESIKTTSDTYGHLAADADVAAAAALD